MLKLVSFFDLNLGIVAVLSILSVLTMICIASITILSLHQIVARAFEGRLLLVRRWAQVTFGFAGPMVGR